MESFLLLSGWGAPVRPTNQQAPAALPTAGTSSSALPSCPQRLPAFGQGILLLLLLLLLLAPGPSLDLLPPLLLLLLRCPPVVLGTTAAAS
jgi:hypothetical protein